MRCLEKDPDDRPRNAADVLRVLEGADAVGGPVAALPKTVARHRRERVTRWVWMSVALGAMAALTAWGLWPRPPARVDNPIVTVVPAAVRVVRPAMTSADSGLVLPFLNAIEAALVQSGAQVFSGSLPDSAAQALFVVETSVQRAGNRARVNVRLINPDPAAEVWAQQLDFALDSAFAAQDQIASRVSDAVLAARARRGG
jgi:hypothetical protein